MKKVLVSVPEKFVEFIQSEVHLKLVASTNEFIRQAIKEKIEKESIFLSNFNSDFQKLSDLHRQYIEFNEQLKQKLFPAYAPSISTVKLQKL